MTLIKNTKKLINEKCGKIKMKKQSRIYLLYFIGLIIVVKLKASLQNNNSSASGNISYLKTKLQGFYGVKKFKRNGAIIVNHCAPNITHIVRIFA